VYLFDDIIGFIWIKSDETVSDLVKNLFSLPDTSLLEYLRITLNYNGDILLPLSLQETPLAFRNQEISNLVSIKFM